jgi:hypothetical protein
MLLCSRRKSIALEKVYLMTIAEFGGITREFSWVEKGHTNFMAVSDHEFVIKWK